MSRTGPGYVETEAELFDDLDLKQDTGEISADVARTFVDLYEFANEIGDRVEIGGAKNANFKLKVTDHRANQSSGNPSIFTANVRGKVKIWPAKMPIDYGYLDSVPWEKQDYLNYERAFQSLKSVPRDAKEAPFEVLTSPGNLEQFKEIVTEFVATCRQESTS